MRWHSFAKNTTVIDTTPNNQLNECAVKPISLDDAKRIIVPMHYMKTWPQGVTHAYGMFYRGKCVGVMVLGVSATTAKKVSKYCNKIKPNQYIELQRTWISDTLKQNAESWMMGRVMRDLKRLGAWLVITHSGGCKDDVGFIFQASGWLYFGFDPCKDFYLTERNEYKNIGSAMRYGRVPNEIARQGGQKAGEFLYGGGKLVEARRHHYAYPIHKGLRRRLKKHTFPFPKDPAIFRHNQSWETS